MSDRLSDCLAFTLTALIVEVMTDNVDDRWPLPPWMLMETRPLS